MSTVPNNPDRTILRQLLIIVSVIVVLSAVVTYLWLANPKPKTHQVLLRVEASGGFSNITLDAGTISIPKTVTVTTPWQKIVELPNNTEVYLTASNPTQTGSLVCVITLDGQPWKREKTEAPKDGVACAGIVP